MKTQTENAINTFCAVTTQGVRTENQMICFLLYCMTILIRSLVTNPLKLHLCVPHSPNSFIKEDLIYQFLSYLSNITFCYRIIRHSLNRQTQIWHITLQWLYVLFSLIEFFYRNSFFLELKCNHEKTKFRGLRNGSTEVITQPYGKSFISNPLLFTERVWFLKI